MLRQHALAVLRDCHSFALTETTVFANELKKEDFEVVILHPGFTFVA